MTQDIVHLNDKYLPLEGEPRDWLTEMGEQIMIGWQRSPIFEELQSSHWTDHFNRLSCKELRELVRHQQPRPVVTPMSNKNSMVAALSAHWRDRLNALTEGA